MIFYILTLFPEMFDGYLESSILGKSIEQKLNDVRLINFRDFAEDRHKNCDDAPYGGGPGMLLKPEPLAAALDHIECRLPVSLGTALSTIICGRAGTGGERGSDMRPLRGTRSADYRPLRHRRDIGGGLCALLRRGGSHGDPGRRCPPDTWGNRFAVP